VFVPDYGFGGFGSPHYRRLSKNRLRAAASEWLKGSLEEEEDKYDIGAALHVIVETPTVGPDEKPRTPEDLAAKTARTTTRPETENKNSETPINTAAKTAEAECPGIVVASAAEFGYVRPA
jgi:hypothetical protein